MTRHDTPSEVAISLARHAPRRIRTLLDPSVGGGNLITPLLNRLKKQCTKVVCVDSDRETVEAISKHFRGVLPDGAKFIHSDFLEWSSLAETSTYDCIVMNPPFAAGKSDLRLFEFVTHRGGFTRSTRYMPLEAAFVCRALELLEPEGRLLAVLPCSIVMSESLQWLRDEILAQGAIQFVHELPPRTFPAVESRMYLMVFDKGLRRRRIALLNHDLHQPERLSIDSANGSISRLDFGHASSSLSLERLLKVECLKMSPLSSLASVIRGDIASPLGAHGAVHTTDFRDGFWRSSERHNRTLVRNQDRRLRQGDLIISRVGRNAHLTCGVGVRLVELACSDCVLIIRPHNHRQSLHVFFALKLMLSQKWVKPLLLRGTGANYISHRSLLDLLIPIGACEKFPLEFAGFLEGARLKSSTRLDQSLQTVTQKFESFLD